MQGGNYHIDEEPLVAIPLMVPDTAKRQRIGDMVTRVIELQQRQAAASTDSRRTQLARLVSELDERIQEEIETLYSLSSAERELIRV